jgi:hypothetical protein
LVRRGSFGASALVYREQSRSVDIMMRVFVTYHLGSLGSVSRESFETELREQLASDSRDETGRAMPFEIYFNAKPGTGFVAAADIVRCEGGSRDECRDWSETIANDILPEVFERLQRRNAGGLR